MHIIIDPAYKPFERHIRYAVDVLLKDVLDIDSDIPVQIIYGNDLPYRESSVDRIIQIIPSNFFTKKTYLSPDSLPQSHISFVEISEFMPLRVNFFEPKLPVLYWGSNKRENVVFKKNNLIIVKADIIASAFFMLTRYEEMIVQKRDKYDRFPACESISFKEGFLHRPIIQEYAELFWDWIKTLVPAASRRVKKFTLRLTHDIDKFKQYTSFAKEVVRIPWALAFKGDKASEAFQRFSEALLVFSGKKKDPNITYERLMDISEEHGARSCFYFMADNVKAAYKISDIEVIKTLEIILERGHEIGLHPNFGSYISYEKLARQKDRLDRILGYENYGARQHYLQWKLPETWRLYEKVGLTHDSSVGFLEMPGYKAGICVPYYVFDLEQGKQLSLIEIPLIVMDASFYAKKYDVMRNKYFKTLLDSNMKEFDIIDYVYYLKRQAQKYNGYFTALWHNGRLNKSSESDYINLISKDSD